MLFLSPLYYSLSATNYAETYTTTTAIHSTQETHTNTSNQSPEIGILIII